MGIPIIAPETKKNDISFQFGECNETEASNLNQSCFIIVKRIFEINRKTVIKTDFFKKLSENRRIQINAQTLRVWFSSEMGELGVPDIFIDGLLKKMEVKFC